ncbi:hypothetical protein BGZ94_010369 [Podila epigama]|nr:hypothetical protein BGZ94_010369 [Podila epigama]
MSVVEYHQDLHGNFYFSRDDYSQQFEDLYSYSISLQRYEQEQQRQQQQQQQQEQELQLQQQEKIGVPSQEQIQHWTWLMQHEQSKVKEWQRWHQFN